MSSPNIDLLVKNGCKPFFTKSGEVYKLALNGEPGAKEPRITITRSRQVFWRLQSEVSIGAWLFGSNLFLPNEKDLQIFQSDMSDFIRYKTGLPFDAGRERTTLLDATKDFYVGESGALTFLKKLSNFQIPKYNRRPFNDTSVYFENKGLIKNKVLKIYSKEHDLINKGGSKEEIELAKGLLRLEIHHGDNRAVSNLAKSQNLPYHNAALMLTRETSEKIIKDAMKLLNFESLLNNDSDDALEKLGQNFDKSMPLTLAGHLAYKAKYGADYYKLSYLNLKPETVKKYERECAKTGTLSL